MAIASSYDLEDLVAKKYTGTSEWAIVFELRGSVGAQGIDRRADAVAFNCWPSTGMHRLAFEIKRTRADFLREVDTPSKRAWLEKYFHQCYFVVTPDIIKDGELPEGWGLLVATKNGKKLIRRKAAKHRDVEPLPEFLALSAIRALSERADRDRHQRHIFEGETITTEDLDAKVTRAVEVQRERMDQDWNHIRKLHRTTKDRKHMLEAPMRELATRAREYGVFPYREEPDITVDTVRRMITKIEQRSLKDVMDKVRAAHSCLGDLVAAVGISEKRSI